MKNEKGWIGIFFAVLGGLVALLFIGALIAIGLYRSMHHETVTFRVKRLEIMSDNSSNGHQYMVYTDKGVFKDVDSVINRKYNSSDVFNSLDEGKTYTCDVTGFRLGFSSDYQNIIKCDSK